MGLLALALVGVLWSVLARPGGDALQAGSRWSGSYYFRPRDAEQGGDVRLTVTERSGSEFRGIYTTLHGAYEWDIAGTVDRGALQLGFTRARKGGAIADALVGKAQLTGSYAGAEMPLVFHDPNDDSVADMTLRLEK
jgi:hypothetical protein